MAVIYEWIVETLESATDDDPDILEVHHTDTLAEARAWAATIEEPTRIGLVRDVGNDIEGLTDRAWAYLENGKLPETFTYGADEDSGIHVPKRFHRETAA